MPFSSDRVVAFSEYTVTALAMENKGKVLTISRADLARVIGVAKLWDKHIDEIAENTRKWDIGTANLGNRIAFVSLEDNPNVRAMDADDAADITDNFESVYGSKAAEVMWENDQYRSRERRKSTSRKS